MGNVFTRNVGWKITSIILAFFIWFAVIRIEDPVDDRLYTHIPVQLLNGDTPIGDSNVISINEKNQYITIEKGGYVNVRVWAKRSVLDELSASDIKATANIQELSPFDAIAIHIDDENFDEVAIEPTLMNVSLENSKERTLTIEPITIGEAKESYRASDDIIDIGLEFNTVTITGAESKVDLVEKAVVDVQIEGASKDVSAYIDIRLYDVNGNEIVLDKSITIKGADKVKVLVPVRKYKTVSIVVNPSGKVANGYKLTGISSILKKVEVIGTEEAIDNLDIITLPIDLDGLNEDTSVPVNINNYLPDGVTVSVKANDKANEETIVELSIDKIIEKEVTISPNDISAKLPPNGLKLSILDEENINLVFRGIENDLNKISSNSLSPNVDLSDLTEGTHEVPLVLSYSGVELVSPLPKINVEITKEVETTTSDNVTEEPSTDSLEPTLAPESDEPSGDVNSRESV